jgi:hypothetical protein
MPQAGYHLLIVRSCTAMVASWIGEMESVLLRLDDEVFPKEQEALLELLKLFWRGGIIDAGKDLLLKYLKFFSILAQSVL